MNRRNHVTLLAGGMLLLMLLFLLNISLGSVAIGPVQILKGIFFSDWEKVSFEQIVINYRLPKAFVAVIAGLGLSLSGLQMQTFFRNPLAGPYVLGISAGAGFGVAILILAGALLGFGMGAIHPWSLALAGTLGAGLILSLVSVVAWRVKDSMTLLIVGIMFGAAVSSIISVLSYFSGAETLKLFTIWSMGSLGSLDWLQVAVLGASVFLGILPVLFSIRSFNALLLGESYAKSMGVNTKKLRWWMIGSTGLMAGAITAFCGPIAFVGIAVPHLARMIWKSADHRVLIPASGLVGAALLLICDSIAQLPGLAESLPINAVTSLIGAPIVIGLVLRRNFSKEF
ncbi:iron complex transport system permease protein [Algoriphagus faecimaris]|uniref:Iron complex transport system permease protein n=1 Tax=Algoriphagus faecimaris TaxID=686796 RepID=A0A1G6VXK0_9BACT|nr:iron ABC transporter permease [Algoriphagus faecimaris]SDD58299.1 iron complex transport system permease protein [Algoriphagus faecimaris]